MNPTNAAVRTARRVGAHRNPLVRDPVPVRPTEHAGPCDAQRRSRGAGRDHAHRLGELRRKRGPVIGSRALAFVQREFGRAVARVAAPAGLDRLRVDPPLLVLVLTTTEEEAMSATETLVTYADASIQRVTTELSYP
jgi:hypothetical protein